MVGGICSGAGEYPSTRSHLVTSESVDSRLGRRNPLRGKLPVAQRDGGFEGREGAPSARFNLVRG